MTCSRCSDIGQCCRYVELPLARSLTADEVSWVELHDGLFMKTPSIIHIAINCSALTEEGLCSLYESPDRPQMCAVWPDLPEEQAPAGCAYLIPASELAMV